MNECTPSILIYKAIASYDFITICSNFYLFHHIFNNKLNMQPYSKITNRALACQQDLTSIE